MTRRRDALFLLSYVRKYRLSTRSIDAHHRFTTPLCSDRPTLSLGAYVRHAPRVVEPKQRLGVGVVATLHGVDFQLEFFPVLRDAALASHQRSETQTPQIYAEVAVGNSPPACGERRAAVVARGVEPHHAFEAPRAVVDCVATRFG